MLKELFHSPQASVQGDLSHPGRDLFAAVVLVGEVQSGIGEKMRPFRHPGFRDQAQATGIEYFRDRSLGHHMHDARLGNGDGVNSGQVSQRPDDTSAAECREHPVEELTELRCGDTPGRQVDLLAIGGLLPDDLSRGAAPHDDVDLDAQVLVEAAVGAGHRQPDGGFHGFGQVLGPAIGSAPPLEGDRAGPVESPRTEEVTATGQCASQRDASHHAGQRGPFECGCERANGPFG